MTYYATIDEDLTRAKQILEKGRSEASPASDDARNIVHVRGGTIYGADTYAAYCLLDSFVEEIDRLRLVTETLREEKRQQYAMLLEIRTLADETTGIDRGQNDERAPGALGAVRALVHLHVTQKESLHALAERLDALAFDVGKLIDSIKVE